MAQKRKSDQTKLTRLKALLEKIEQQTARKVKGHLGRDWRDNLFEVMMTRLELAAPHRKALSGLPDALREKPEALPGMTRTFCRTMKGILTLARAPRCPHHVAAFGVLYVSVIDTFLKDKTKDHAKTMAALDHRLGLFEDFVKLTGSRA